MQALRQGLARVVEEPYTPAMPLDLSAADAAVAQRALWEVLKRVEAGDRAAMVKVDGMFRQALSGDRTLIDAALCGRRARKAEQTLRLCTEKAPADAARGMNTHRCQACRKRISIKVSTMFQHTELELRSRFAAILMVTRPPLTWHCARPSYPASLPPRGRTYSFNKAFAGSALDDPRKVEEPKRRPKGVRIEPDALKLKASTD